jgi:hypothetical protein
MKLAAQWLRYLALLFLIIPQLAFSAGSTGTDFWVTFPDHPPFPVNLKLFISSQTATSGTVSILSPSFSQSFTVTPGSVTSIDIPATAKLSGSSNLTVGAGVHVTSANPITLYGLSDEMGSADGFLGLPVDALGSSYRIMSYTGTPGYSSYFSHFAIVGTQNSTTITITPSVDAAGGHMMGVPFSITLNQGDAYQLKSNLDTTDLTGTLVTADKPIAVFGGSDNSLVPAGVNYSNTLLEQLPPINSYGSEFVAIPFVNVTRGDRVRVLAATDSTQVSLNGSVVATINAGQFHEFELTTATKISTSNPTLVAQYHKGINASGTGDPFMIILPAVDQFLSRYEFSHDSTTYTYNTGTWSSSSQYINIFAPNTAINSITLDGTSINPASFTSLGSTGYSYFRTASLAYGTHTLVGAIPFGAVIYNYIANFQSAYGFPAGVSYSAAPASAPTVTAVGPSVGTSTGGTSITITGTGFTGATGVTVGGAACTPFTVVSDTSITCTTPAGAAGTASVVVTTPDGSNAANTLYTYASINVTAISPATGPTSGGQSVTITGWGFTGALRAYIGGVRCRNPFTVVSDTQIVCNTGANAAGVASVVVTDSNGVNTGPNTLYTYAALPLINSISPSSGPTTGGTQVTILGDNLTVAPFTVTFCGVPATVVSVLGDPPGVIVSAPAHAVGACDVVVTTPDGSDTRAGGFTYVAPPPAPTVTAIGPASGNIAGGQPVIITGTNFTGATSVTIGGVACTPFTVISATSISCTTGAHAAGTASVSVTTPGGSNAANTLYTYASVTDGTCGAAQGQAALLKPTAGLCGAGTASSVTANNGSYTWSCAGTGVNSQTAQCSAPGTSSGQTGTVTFENLAGGCSVGSVSRQPTPAGGPAGVTLPFGVVDFALVGCSGSSATIRTTYSSSLAGMRYWKYINGGWRVVPEAVISGNTVTLTIQDNDPLLDADPTVGAISDPSGPGLGGADAGAVNNVPTLSEWGLIVLSALVGLMTLGAMRRRRV